MAKLPVPAEDGGLAIIYLDARGLPSSAGTGSYAITSAFFSGFEALISHPQASSSHRCRRRPSLFSPSVSNISPPSSHSSKSKSLHRIVAIAENKKEINGGAAALEVRRRRQ